MGDHAKSELLMSRALLAARVSHIDGDDVPFPASQQAYRAMLQRVGREGLEAVVIHLGHGPSRSNARRRDRRRKKLTRHPRARAVMALTGGVVPWEVAEKMKPWQLMTFSVIAGEIKGGEFDWRQMKWRERK